MDTAVPRVSSRSAVNEPRMATPPMARGRLAAARLPKITSSRIKSSGIDSVSARLMSPVTCLLIASSVGITPPALAVRPGTPRLLLMASKLLIRAASLPPASSSTA